MPLRRARFAISATACRSPAGERPQNLTCGIIEAMTNETSTTAKSAPNVAPIAAANPRSAPQQRLR